MLSRTETCFCGKTTRLSYRVFRLARIPNERFCTNCTGPLPWFAKTHLQLQKRVFHSIEMTLSHQLMLIRHITRLLSCHDPSDDPKAFIYSYVIIHKHVYPSTRRALRRILTRLLSPSLLKKFWIAAD